MRTGRRLRSDLRIQVCNVLGKLIDLLNGRGRLRVDRAEL